MPLHFGGDPHNPDVALEHFAGNIRTYNEEVAAGDELRQAKEWLRNASRIVFLGFHFHRQNVELMSVSSPTSGVHARHVYATTFGRKAPERTVIASQITAMLPVNGGDMFVHNELAGCRDLFEHYGTSLTV